MEIFQRTKNRLTIGKVGAPRADFISLCKLCQAMQKKQHDGRI
jgi:hypothetical protein